MRERAALLGGTLDVSASNGTFRVDARLPYGAAAMTPSASSSSTTTT